jgi:hypothetical protein
VNVRIGTDRPEFPIDNFSSINIGLRSKYLRDFVSKDLCHEWFLMSSTSAGSTIQVGVSVDEVTKSHGFTARVRDKVELLLHKIEDCAELSLSSLIKH